MNSAAISEDRHSMNELCTIVDRIARGIARRVPSHVALEDLVSAGHLGLAQALHRKPETVDSSFKAYAAQRVRGAILDELRGLDPLSRRQRKKVRSIDKVTRKLQGELGRTPDCDEVAEAANLDRDRYFSILQQAKVQHVTDDVAGDRLGRADLFGREESTPCGEDAVIRACDASRVEGAINQLPERLRLIIRNYYHGEQSLSEIGRQLGVSEARVHQLRGEALRMMRAALEPRPSLLPAPRASARRRHRKGRASRPVQNARPRLSLVPPVEPAAEPRACGTVEAVVEAA